MNFVALLQTAQDRDRILDRRLIDQDRLEPPFKRGIFFDMFAVLIERGGSDKVQFTPREHGLEQVCRIHRTLGSAGSDDRVQLVDEQ